MKRVYIAVSSLALAVIIVIAIGSYARGDSAPLPPISQQCADHVGDDGFGTADVNSHISISNSNINIPVPCRIILHQNGWLTLINSSVQSANLVIRDDDNVAENRVDIINSKLTGTKGSGILIDLSDPQDSISVANSTLKYDASVWVRVSGAKAIDGGGKITASDSAFISNSESGQGIVLMAGDTGGGEASFTNVTLKTPTDQTKLLLGQKCTATNVYDGTKCSSI